MCLTLINSNLQYKNKNNMNSTSLIIFNLNNK